MTSPNQSVAPCICGKVDCDILFGTCHCGCGEKTKIAFQTDVKSRTIGGYPKRFKLGHHGRIRLKVEYSEPFKIDGVYCRLIPLTQGQWAIVDESDYYWLMQWKWCARWNPCTRSYYAARATERVDGRKFSNTLMHRQILGLEFGDKVLCDHEDAWATTDNRRKNIRDATATENCQNRRTRRTNKCGLKGVYYHEKKRKWIAQIEVNGVNKYLGQFDTREEAYAAYCEAAKKYFGKFARVA